jgi:phenylacetate-coenzyme A ligase PaaK-like adenylate-forming protein/predicted lipid-binding transport protein (Tim44 family)
VPFWPEERVRARADARARAIADEAAAHVPYYRRLLRPGEIRGVADLAELPLLDKAAVRDDPTAFRSSAPEADEGLSLRTTGSTWEPLTVFHDRRSLLLNIAFAERERAVETRFVGRSLRYVALDLGLGRTITTPQEVRAFYDRACYRPLRPRHHAAGVDEPLEDVVATIDRLRPDVVRGYGTYLELLFRTAAAEGLSFHLPRVVVYTADGMTEEGRRLVEERFGVPVLSQYSAVEVFRIGYFCEERRAHHVHEDLCGLSVVADGRPVPDGEPGEVVVSNLVNRGTVLLNYRLGDVARDRPRPLRLRPHVAPPVGGRGPDEPGRPPPRRELRAPVRGVGADEAPRRRRPLPARPARARPLRAPARHRRPGHVRLGRAAGRRRAAGDAARCRGRDELPRAPRAGPRGKVQPGLGTTAVTVRQWAAVMRPSLTRTGALRLALALVALILLALSAAGVALGDAGGGSGDFGGGGGGGGGGGDFGGGGSDFGGDSGDGAGGGGSWIFFLVVLGGIVAIGCSILIYNSFYFGGRASVRATQLRSGLSRKRRRKRVERVELAAAEAAEDDERFAPEQVRSAAEQLFRDVQAAWDQRDEARLATMLGPELLVEWKRHLAGFERKGWHNRVQVLGEVRVDYVGLTNREGASDDRVVVFIEATLRDYVENRRGRKIHRKGASSETTARSQYWTLGIRDGRWILLSIERGAEGDHNLTDAIVASPWGDTARLHDEATIETAATDGLPAGYKPADLADLDFEGDARAAALDLSLADPRFAPDVLEAEVRRIVEAWAEAVDGEDTALARLATRPALHQLLYQGDESEKTRLVVRGPRVKRIAIVALDAKAEPATMTVEVELGGRRYVEDRDTASVLSGSKTEAAVFTERWTLALDGPAAHPWRIAAAEAEVVAHS